MGLLIMACILVGCKESPNLENAPPNILWIYLEDTSPLLNSYGNTLVQTPNIDKLADQGTVYSNAFMPAPVCSASRSSIITGLMSTTTGTHNHHSSRTPESAILLPQHIKTIPEVFRMAGYFTFNNGKDDYNFEYNRKDLYNQEYSQHPLYGKKGEQLEFSVIAGSQPFFGQIQLAGGKEIFSPNFKSKVKTPIDRSKIELPPYLPNHPKIIEEYANHLDAIQITDEKVGALMKELSSHELLDNTIVFFFSDHGMRLIRHKQFLYDGGLHVPLIIADFRKEKAILQGFVNDDLVSGLDLGTSALALANIPIPDYMEGRNIFDDSIASRTFVISTRDRCDFTIDRIRSVRSKEFKYIRNFMTDRPYMQPTYMDVDEVEFVTTMKQLYVDGKLNPVQSQFFSKERPAEELYYLKKDPFEINNLAEDPNYVETRTKYASILQEWTIATDDQGQYPENKEGLKLMLGIWGDHAINPEYESLREEFRDLPGSQLYLKRQQYLKVED
ncbi:MAG: sulfatase [Maribacter sp.]|uniref:sulfatase family protein n=1 Tax=Maribacter sp. TaxID=1897614 RepID=UPI0032994FCF